MVNQSKLVTEFLKFKCQITLQLHFTISFSIFIRPSINKGFYLFVFFGIAKPQNFYCRLFRFKHLFQLFNTDLIELPLNMVLAKVLMNYFCLQSYFLKRLKGYWMHLINWPMRSQQMIMWFYDIQWAYSIAAAAKSNQHDIDFVIGHYKTSAFFTQSSIGLLEYSSL